VVPKRVDEAADEPTRDPDPSPPNEPIDVLCDETLALVV